MIYFFHHYELPVIVQQAQLQQMFMRSHRNNNNNNNTNRENTDGQAGGNQQQAPHASGQQAVTESPPANNIFTIRGIYRRRVNHLVERLRNNFYNNVFGVGLMADNNNNNANQLPNQPGFNNLTRSLRLLNAIFPNRPILNVRIINVRSASAAAVADILRNAEGTGNVTENPVSRPSEQFPSVVRLQESSSTTIQNGETVSQAVPSSSRESDDDVSRNLPSSPEYEKDDVTSGKDAEVSLSRSNKPVESSCSDVQKCNENEMQDTSKISQNESESDAIQRQATASQSSEQC